MNTNFPSDQDLGTEAFILTDNAVVEAELGRVYPQSECIAASPFEQSFKFKQSPIPRQFIYYNPLANGGTKWDLATDISNEITNGFQQYTFNNALASLYDVWKNNYLINNRVVMLVVTKCEIVSQNQYGSTASDPSETWLAFGWKLSFVPFVPIELYREF